MGSFTTLLIYNLPHIIVRFCGFDRGWREGLRILNVLKSPELDAILVGIRAVISFGIGLLAGLLVLGILRPEPTRSGVFQVGAALSAVVIACVAYFMLKNRLSFIFVVYIVAALSVLMFMLMDSGIFSS